MSVSHLVLESGNEQKISKELWTVKDVATFLDFHKNTVYKLLENGKLPVIRIGREIRFKRGDIEDWLKQNSYSPVPLPELHRVEILTGVYDKINLKGGFKNPVGKRTRWEFGNGAHVYLRTNPGGTRSWGIEFRDENGKRKQHIVPNALSLEDAKTVLFAKVREAFDRQHGIVRPKRLKFIEFADQFLRDYAKNEKKSWKTDEYRLRKMKVYFGDIEISSITSQQIREYRASRLEVGISPLTANRDLALLKKMFNWAKEEGYADLNPVEKIKFFSETDTIRDRVLSLKEEQRLFKELPDHQKPIILVALHTGLRYREVLGLNWKNLDLERKAIKAEHTKSKKARFIPMNSALLEVFSCLSGMKKHPDFVFPFNDIRKGFKNACRRAEIHDFTFHDLRRTFGTRLLENGLDIVSISRLYGHSSVLVTERYLHPKDARSVEALERLVEMPEKSAEISKQVLQICDTKKNASKNVPLTLPFSMN